MMLQAMNRIAQVATRQPQPTVLADLQQHALRRTVRTSAVLSPEELEIRASMLAS